MSDPFDTPEAEEWLEHLFTDVVPQIEASAVSVSLVPKDAHDVKFAVELGLSIMLDKPIIAVILPGTPVPEHLVRVADAIIEGDPNDPEAMAPRLNEALKRLLPEDR